MQIFLDCDGVLADFDLYASEILGMPPREFEAQKGDSRLWEILYSTKDYFFNLPKMVDADELVNGVLERGYEPIILTGIPSKEGSDWAIDQKQRWRRKHYPDLKMITCKSKDKLLHMVEGKHNILIDDWPKWRHLWEEGGGTFILHTSASTSLSELDNILKGSLSNV